MKTFINAHTNVSKLFAAIAIVAILVASAPFVSAQGAPVQVFSASVTPGTINAGEVNKSFSFTITNSNTSDAVIKSASITLPAGFTVTNLSVDDAEFEVDFNAPDIETSLISGNDGIDPGDSLTITADITNTSGSGNSSWNVCAFKNNSFNPADGAAFDIEGGTGCGSVTIEIIGEQPETGSLTIEKVVNGENVPAEWQFDFTSNIPNNANFFLDEVTTEAGFTDLPVGVYSVSEIDGGEDWELTDLQCVGTDTWSDEGGGDLSVTLVDGDDVTCTFTNTYTEPTTPTATGTMTVYKVVNDESGTQVEFDFVIDSSNNAFDGEMDIMGSSSQSRNDILPALYTFTESVEPGWTLNDVVCEAEGGSTFDYEVANGVTVDFEEGDTVSCTFYNNIVNPDLGSISGTKYDTSEYELSGWTIFIDENDNQILDGEEVSVVTDIDGDYSFPNLEDGTYSVCEVMQDGWEQTYPDTINGCHEVTIVEGSDETANFVNYQLPSETIQMCKYDEESGEPVEGWGMTLTNDTLEGTYNLVTGEDGCVYQDVNPEDGPWRVYEDEVSGWNFIDAEAFGGTVVDSQGQAACEFFPEIDEQEFSLFAILVDDVQENFRCNFYNEEEDGGGSSTGGGGNGKKIELRDDGDDEEPEPEVLGETDVQTEILPAGAPNAGMGGAAAAAQGTTSLFALISLIASALFARKFTN